MAANWYYGKNGTQSGPVAVAELRSLAESGELRTSDLVWEEGMPSWVNAGTVSEIFPAANPNDAGFASNPQSTPPSIDLFPQSGEPDDFLRERDERSRRRRERHRSKWPVVPIFIGVGLLTFLGGTLLFIAPQVWQPQKNGSRNWSLGRNRSKIFRIYFHKNHRVYLNVRSEGMSDVDLFVYDGDKLIAKDIAFNSDASITFVAGDNKSYRVKVWNRVLMPDPQSRNSSNSGTLTYDQVDLAAMAESDRLLKAEREKAAKQKQEQEEPQGGRMEEENAPVPNNKQDTPAAKPKKTTPRNNPPKTQPRIPTELPEKLRDRGFGSPNHQPVIAPPNPLPIHQTFSGVLSKDRSARGKHTIFLQANTEYEFHLESGAFDPILELRSDKSRLLRMHDDVDYANADDSARIVWTPRDSGTYYLHVRRFGFDGTGPYGLRVRR